MRGGRLQPRRLAWEHGALCPFVTIRWVSSSHRNNSSGPNRSRGSASRTTRQTCGLVIRGIFPPQAGCRVSRKAPPRRHRARW